MNDNTAKPIILYEGKNTIQNLEDLKNKNRVWQEVDLYEDQLKELFEILNPNLRFSPDYTDRQRNFINQKTNNKNGFCGNWIYFPWNGYLIHMVNEEEYNLIRTNRNKNLINADEQNKLFNLCIGVAGLSIGGNMSVGFVYNGISNNLKLAEFDTLSTSNLNRLKSGIFKVGLPKISVISQQIYEANPYINLHLFPNGLKKEDLDSYFNNPRPNVIFEAIDDFEMKVRIRLKARGLGIPVIMITNLGDNLLVDIERYDLDPNLPIFNGLIGNTPEEILNTDISEKEKTKYAVNIVGIEHVPTRALESLFEINKTLVGRPQLFSTVNVGTGFASYLARKIALGEELPSGRTYISFNKLLQIDHGDEKEKPQRDMLIEKFNNLMSV